MLYAESFILVEHIATMCAGSGYTAPHDQNGCALTAGGVTLFSTSNNDCMEGEPLDFDLLGADLINELLLSEHNLCYNNLSNGQMYASS